MVKVLSFSFDQCFGPFTCYFLKGPLKRYIFIICLTTCFGVRKLKNTSAMNLFSAVNGLKNSRKILNITQRDFFNQNYFQSNQ